MQLYFFCRISVLLMVLTAVNTLCVMHRAVGHKLKNIGASPSGKASAFGADIRWFESSRPSQEI